LPIINAGDEVTDPVLLSHLEWHNLNKDDVEFTQDYSPRYDKVTGKRRKEHSPYAKFYRQKNTNRRFMVVSSLPMLGVFQVSELEINPNVVEPGEVVVRARR